MRAGAGSGAPGDDWKRVTMAPPDGVFDWAAKPSVWLGCWRSCSTMPLYLEPISRISIFENLTGSLAASRISCMSASSSPYKSSIIRWPAHVNAVAIALSLVSLSCGYARKARFQNSAASLSPVKSSQTEAIVLCPLRCRVCAERFQLN